MKISKPFAKSFMTLLGGEVVSYSPKSCKVAIGLEAFKVFKEEMEEIINTYDGYSERWHLVVKLWKAKKAEQY